MIYDFNIIILIYSKQFEIIINFLLYLKLQFLYL